jgi:hypothetical protein
MVAAATAILKDIDISNTSKVRLVRRQKSVSAGGVDLTFATRLATNSESECQILNSTRNLFFLVVL